MTCFAPMGGAEVDMACRRENKVVVGVDLVVTCHPDLDWVGHLMDIAWCVQSAWGEPLDHDAGTLLGHRCDSLGG